MRPRNALAVAALAILGTSCKHDSVLAATQSISVSPRTISMSSGQSVDIQVTVVGFAIGTAFTCRVVPASAGTVVGDLAKCRLTVSTPAVPGTLMIAQIGSLADTATVAVPAR